MGERLPIAPLGLGTAGKALWHRLVRQYELSAGQLEVLRSLCRTEDRLTDVRAALDGAELVLQGKMGQRAHPLLATERDLMGTMLRGFRAIGIHEDEAAEPQPYDSRRRQAAAILGHQRARGG